MKIGRGETWRPVAIEGYEHLYEVSDCGRVRNIPEARGGYTKQRYLKHNRDTSGYPQVCLCNNGKRKTIGVHKLVALTFIGPQPVGMEVCHNNGDQLDLRPENLRWDTRANNSRDKIRHGTHNWLVSKGGVIPDDYYEGE